MKYKFLDNVFLKKDLEKFYVYSLGNEDLVVVATGIVCDTIELLKKGASVADVRALWGEEGEDHFRNLYDKFTSCGLTIHSEAKVPKVLEGMFKYSSGTIQFTTFDQLIPTKNVEVYASYCATSSCSYCDNCSCSDC